MAYYVLCMYMCAYTTHVIIPPGGVVGNMLALHAVNPGSILGRGDT